MSLTAATADHAYKRVMTISKPEPLPTAQPVTGPGRAAARRAALMELHECRELLKYPSPLLASPRMRRRYDEAVKLAAMYRDQEDAS
jgi:hypothetical protein